VVSRWRMGWKGTGKREVESEKKAWWLWFFGGREFETRQWRELGESGILIDLSFRDSGCLFVRHGYPWVPTDQTHGRPRQVSPAYQKTHRPVSGPNRPSWRPIRPREDLPEDSPDDLIHHDLKTWCIRQDLGGFRRKQIDGIWQDVQRRLRSPGCNRPGVWETTSSAGQYKADEVTPLYNPTNPAIPKQYKPKNWT
jgi:hypothetical protein